MKLKEWQTVRGADLEKAVLMSDPLEDHVLQCQAIYMWRRSLTPPPQIVSNRVSFRKWLNRSLEKPFAKIGSVDLSHTVHLVGLALGGGPLTDAKLTTLEELLANSKNREFLANFLTSLTAYTPPLYVGETKTLPKRVRQHVNGETQFSIALKEDLGLDWEDLEFCYFGISKSTDGADSEIAKARRTLFELIASRLVFAGSVSRPG